MAWTTEIYTLSGGMFTDESVLELARGSGKDSGPRARDEVLVLVLSLNLSGDSGKSLHLLLLPHLGSGNTSKLNSYHERVDTICESTENAVCQSIFKYKVNRQGLTSAINSFHIKNLFYIARVQISSKERLIPVTTDRRQTQTSYWVTKKDEMVKRPVTHISFTYKVWLSTEEYIENLKSPLQLNTFLGI